MLHLLQDKFLLPTVDSPAVEVLDPRHLVEAVEYPLKLNSQMQAELIRSVFTKQ